MYCNLELKADLFFKSIEITEGGITELFRPGFNNLSLSIKLGFKNTEQSG